MSPENSSPNNTGSGTPVSPLVELDGLLQRLEDRLSRAREAYIESIRPPPPPAPADDESNNNKKPSFFENFRRLAAHNNRPPHVAASPSNSSHDGIPLLQHQHQQDQGEAEDPTVAEVPPAPAPSPEPPTRRNDKKRVVSKFIDIPDMESLVEDLRRIAELVVIGENYVTSQEKKVQQEMERSRRKWSNHRDILGSDSMLAVGSDGEPPPLATTQSAPVRWKPLQHLQSQAQKQQTPHLSDDEDLANGAAEEEATPLSPDYADVFDLFFERNTLATLVELLTGHGFDTPDVRAMEAAAAAAAAGQTLGPLPSSPNGSNHGLPPPAPAPPSAANSAARSILLPPLAIATQAVQSISILVQNVSRATSLYILFSNDHINDMIGLDLHLYEQAEQRQQQLISLSNNPNPDTSFTSSAEVAELTTHFVTFLKSLALRMNVETLQFFLQYPEDYVANQKQQQQSLVESASSSSESSKRIRNKSKAEKKDAAAHETPSPSASTLIEGYDPATLQVKFPLYDRALDFCAADQDSFIRVTAMNICLNTIRLTTVSNPTPKPPIPHKENSLDAMNLPEADEEVAELPSKFMPWSSESRSSSTPEASLHKANALPFRERLAIAQHTCTPSRVEQLIAPIFTKLSERWTSLDESIRDLDGHPRRQSVLGGGAAPPSGASTPESRKVARTKEQMKREKLANAFQDCAADLQDELLLLEDVFKVGLVVLNEQMIEMMLATFVYPLLLQPLMTFSQRYQQQTSSSNASEGGPSPQEKQEQSKQASKEGSTPVLPHPFASGTTSGTNIDQLAPFVGPAKTALFTMASVFHFLTNPPLLRLLFTALLHPISPDSTTVPTVRSTLQVASVDAHGRGSIRLDATSSKQQQQMGDGDFTANGDVVIISDSRQSYPFGTKNEPDRRSSSRQGQAAEGTVGNGDEETPVEACVFVLAPALAEVLEFQGQDHGLIARTRPNAYRQALLQCIQLATTADDANVHDTLSQVRSLAVCTLDAALSRFDSKLATDLLYGVNMNTFATASKKNQTSLLDDDPNSFASQENDEAMGSRVLEMKESSSSAPPRHSTQDVAAMGTDLVRQVLVPLAAAVVTGKPNQSSAAGEWKLSFDDLAAHALLVTGKGSAGGLVTSCDALERRLHQAAKFATQLPSVLHRKGTGNAPTLASYILGVGAPPVQAKPDYDLQMLGAVMNALVYGVAAGERDAPLETFWQVQQKQQRSTAPPQAQHSFGSSDGSDESHTNSASVRDCNLSMEVSRSAGFNEMANRVVSYILTDNTTDDLDYAIATATTRQQRSAAIAAKVSRTVQELRSSVNVVFQVDALLALLKELQATHSAALRPHVQVAGLAFCPARQLPNNNITAAVFVPTQEYKHSKSVFANLSTPLAETLLRCRPSDDADESVPSSGTRLPLAGYPAIPCVCEAPASLSHLFANPGSGIVAQGVTWQSLYLVFKEGWMILAQPIPGAAAEGRVIGACLLERLYVDKDSTPVPHGSPARRLLLAHSSWRHSEPPPLFLFDEDPDETLTTANSPRLTNVASYVSHLDVWCENERSSDYAYQVASSQIFAAKAQRGRRLQAYWKRQEEKR